MSTAPANVHQRSPRAVDAYVGSRVRQRRFALGMTQEKLAEQLGVTFQQVQKYERGTNRIGASRLHQIALVLQVPITHFFEGVLDGEISPAADAPLVAHAVRDPATVRLVRAFHSISDPLLQQKVIGIIEAIAQTTVRERG